MMADTVQEILLVEDDAVIREAVTAYLMAEGYQVTGAADGSEALTLFTQGDYSLVILDWMLPKVSGKEVCQRIRCDSDVLIIMLTARGEEKDRIAGLEFGADDYLVKPFSLRELVARINALFRRAQLANDPVRRPLVFDDLTIDLSGRRVMLKDEEIALTANEFKLLSELACHPGRVYSRLELVEKVLDCAVEGYERTIDTHMKNLRFKLAEDPADPRWLFTVYGTGYRFGDSNV